MVSWEREARTLGTPHPAQSPPRGGAVAHTSVCLLGTERERERTRSTSALALVGVVHQRDRSAERRRRPPPPHTHTLRTDPRSRTSGPQTPRTTRPVYARNARPELPRRSVFDLSVSGRPGASKAEGGGEERKQENRGGRGPGLKTLTDLVQEGCNGRNGRNGPQPGADPETDGGRGHPDLRWDSTTQSTRGFDGRRGHP